MRASLALVLVLLSGGCCAGPEYMALAWDTRSELERRERFVLLAPVLEDPTAWAFGDTAAGAYAGHYRPLVTLAPERDRIAPGTEAPAQLRRALEAARRGLRELGYRPATAVAPPDLVLALGLSWGEDERLLRVSIQVGGLLDGRFQPDLIGLAAVVAEDDACPQDVEELVGQLVGFLPRREEEDEGDEARD